MGSSEIEDSGSSVTIHESWRIGVPADSFNYE